MRRGRWIAALALGVLRLGAGQVALAQTPGADPPIAFVNVNVISMENDRLQAGRTVLVRSGRVAAVGLPADVPLPEGTRVIDGMGRFLLPGLTDAHVHLEGDGTGFGSTRPDFGDAPLYLAHGVTTVFNLAGTPVHLEWRRRIAAGEMAGPTIYTSGPFVNEPRVSTVDEVRSEVARQVREGYDLIKFHELYEPRVGWTTTRGLSREAYLAVNDAAREAGIPLIGHAPANLGLATLLQARQSLAHIGTLTQIDFLPLAAHPRWLVVTIGSILALVLVGVADGAAAMAGRRRSVKTPRPPNLSRARVVMSCLLMAGLVAIVCAALFLPGGPFFNSVALRLLFTALVIGMVPLSALLLRSAEMLWRDQSVPLLTRLPAAIGSIAAMPFVAAAIAFWLPVVWQSSDAGIERLAGRLRDAGIQVQTTMVVYDALGGPGKSRLVADPAVEYLRPDVRARWSRFDQPGPPGYRYTDFMKKVAGTLQRSGVRLMAGTDAMGYPLVVPGSSLHRELELLVESGLTPYDAMRAATVTPAAFLRKANEFGAIAVGQRADLVMVERNPLEDVRRLRHPVGVMARGRWFTRTELDHMLAALVERESP